MQHTNGETDIAEALQLTRTQVSPTFFDIKDNISISVALYIIGYSMLLSLQIYRVSNGDRPTARDMVLLITDGYHTHSSDVQEEARKAREDGIGKVSYHFL